VANDKFSTLFQLSVIDHFYSPKVENTKGSNNKNNVLTDIKH